MDGKLNYPRFLLFLIESSARSPESGLHSDWPKNNRALGALLRLVYRTANHASSKIGYHGRREGLQVIW